uniref:Reverse transcriptase domain-containing protein n=1 Tax=Anguilla anguilla TaxID=7936 RepID=A0A0E9Q4V6_ANGAN
MLQSVLVGKAQKNYPSTFKRLMNRVLAGLEGCAAYMDAVVVFSDTWTQQAPALWLECNWAEGHC